MNVIFTPFLLILEVKLSSFTTEYHASWGLVICGLYFVDVCSLCTHIVESFFLCIINGCCILLTVFSASLDMIV